MGRRDVTASGLARQAIDHVLGPKAGIAGRVYGTVVTMATITAASGGDLGLWRLAALTGTTLVVLWIAHVYAHVLSVGLQRGRVVRFAEVRVLAGQEAPIAIASVAPLVAVVLGAVGLLAEGTAVWAAIGLCLATLGAEALRYAKLQHERPLGQAIFTGAAVGLGLVVVALKVLVAH